ncbi:Polyadenylate-binding protein RBP47A [Acorus gramineus]|uniref:Polyadenylate-binding protein RBP47A n=1 Tax=Acorus gramineus TaxID=55184 RepID=A0AAV9ABN6_ACOGR|nr:Polyadenylate-binding protein RBP47A [Acorus gramineus]
MDFDEYDYLEKTVENVDLPKEKEKESSANANGGGSVKADDRERSRSSKHAREDDGRGDSEGRPKRSRSEDDRRHRQRHRSSPDRRSREGSEREHRHREHREERNGRDGNRERERTRDRDRDVDRERERDKERERERSRRSRSHSERRRERDEQEKSRERELREREKERERERELREREREGRRHKDKKEEAEPEADPERDQRTVFAYQICLKADERDVYEFFSRAGKVRDVRLIMDRNSRRSKGVGYIEFYDAMSVPMAIALSGQPLLGQPVMVKPSEAEKNQVQSNAAAAGGPGGLIGPYSGGVRRLYVGNLHFNITEDQLRQVFEPFGHVELVQLPLDQETGQCKGFGFVQFARLEDARAAQSLNGQLEIAGRVIKVSAVSDQVGMQDVGLNAGDFDDDEGGGLVMNARSRALLMQKLDRTGTASSVAGALAPPVVNGQALSLPTVPILGATPNPLLIPSAIPALAGLPGAGVLPLSAVPSIDTIGVPSECLMLKNMFDPAVETEPDFELDIKDDVQDECSKFGTVQHIHVDKNSAGHVYLRFDTANSAINAQKALHGRWFAGKMITASFMTPQNYQAKFPNST